MACLRMWSPAHHGDKQWWGNEPGLEMTRSCFLVKISLWPRTSVRPPGLSRTDFRGRVGDKASVVPPGPVQGVSRSRLSPGPEDSNSPGRSLGGPGTSHVVAHHALSISTSPALPPTPGPLPEHGAPGVLSPRVMCENQQVRRRPSRTRVPGFPPCPRITALGHVTAVP
jgi:hypothetical protein